MLFKMPCSPSSPPWAWCSPFCSAPTWSWSEWFSWPGIGSYALEALIASDYAPVQGFVLTLAVLYVLVNLLIDIAYGVIDPRVRVEG